MLAQFGLAHHGHSLSCPGCASVWLRSRTPWRTPITTASSGASQNTTQGSLYGRLACQSMAFVSNDGSGNQQDTCTVSRSGGTYIETRGNSVATVAPPVLALPNPRTATANGGTAGRSSVQVSWKENSNNQTGFVIERCDQIIEDISSVQLTAICRGAWETVGSVVANAMTYYIDDTVTANQTYIYRVKATNQSRSSAHTPEAVIHRTGALANNHLRQGIDW